MTDEDRPMTDDEVDDFLDWLQALIEHLSNLEATPIEDEAHRFDMATHAEGDIVSTVPRKAPSARRPRSHTHWREVVADLKTTPGEWGEIGPRNLSVGHLIRRGDYAAFLPDDGPDMSPAERRAYMREHWEVTTRKDPSTGDRTRPILYVRWLGE